jgi:hypothetical protein
VALVVLRSPARADAVESGSGEPAYADAA